MRVGVVVDAFNLYYAGRKLCGRGTAGWRWLDIRSLAKSLIAEQSEIWPDAQIERLVYCTARIDWHSNPGGATGQRMYLGALTASGSVDHIEYGNYVAKVMKRPLAIENAQRKPVLVRPAWPIMIRQNDTPVNDATFMASVATWEEKGSDVNVASHLLVEVLDRRIDCALVITNDSDLKWPVQEARRRVPVGMVNPGSGYTSGHLSASSDTGAGGHWWRTLTSQDFTRNQLPDTAGRYWKPEGW